MSELTSQYIIFKDCLARSILSHSDLRDPSADDDRDASDASLDEFTSYLSLEIWPFLSAPLQSASFEINASDLPDIDTLPLDHIPLSFADTLISCGLAGDTDDALARLRRVLAEYVAEACAPPPVWAGTRGTCCELCARAVPLTYHHLVPRQMHTRARKRKWHPEALLDSVAWLCRPCHSTVHRVASNEELAKEFFTVERLLAREDIQKWRKYAAKQRYGVKRG